MIETYTNNNLKERFELKIDDELVAWIDYRSAFGVLALNHTEVDKRFRGRGYAGDLVAFALAHARLHSVRIEANCSFVASFIKRHTEYGDLVA